MWDLIKDDVSFSNYLVKQMGMCKEAAEALLDSSFSFLEVSVPFHNFTYMQFDIRDDSNLAMSPLMSSFCANDIASWDIVCLDLGFVDCPLLH